MLKTHANNLPSNYKNLAFYHSSPTPLPAQTKLVRRTGLLFNGEGFSLVHGGIDRLQPSEGRRHASFDVPTTYF